MTAPATSNAYKKQKGTENVSSMPSNRLSGMKWLTTLLSALGPALFHHLRQSFPAGRSEAAALLPGRGGRFTANGSFSGSSGCRACTFQRGDGSTKPVSFLF